MAPLPVESRAPPRQSISLIDPFDDSASTLPLAPDAASDPLDVLSFTPPRSGTVTFRLMRSVSRRPPSKVGATMKPPGWRRIDAPSCSNRARAPSSSRSVRRTVPRTSMPSSEASSPTSIDPTSQATSRETGPSTPNSSMMMKESSSSKLEQEAVRSSGTTRQRGSAERIAFRLVAS